MRTIELGGGARDRDHPVPDRTGDLASPFPARTASRCSWSTATIRPSALASYACSIKDASCCYQLVEDGHAAVLHRRFSIVVTYKPELRSRPSGVALSTELNVLAYPGQHHHHPGHPAPAPGRHRALRREPLTDGPLAGRPLEDPRSYLCRRWRTREVTFAAAAGPAKLPLRPLQDPRSYLCGRCRTREVTFAAAGGGGGRARAGTRGRLGRGGGRLAGWSCSVSSGS